VTVLLDLPALGLGELDLKRLNVRSGAGKSWSLITLTTLDVSTVALRDTLAMTLDVVAVCTEEFA
jgi:hypothetical protein